MVGRLLSFWVSAYFQGRWLLKRNNTPRTRTHVFKRKNPSSQKTICVEQLPTRWAPLPVVNGVICKWPYKWVPELTQLTTSRGPHRVPPFPPKKSFGDYVGGRNPANRLGYINLVNYGIN